MIFQKLEERERDLRGTADAKIDMTGWLPWHCATRIGGVQGLHLFRMAKYIISPSYESNARYSQLSCNGGHDCII